MKTRIVGFGNPSAAYQWRIEDPFKYLEKKGFEVMLPHNFGINEEVAQWGDIFVLQACTDKEGIALLREYQVEHGKKIIVDCDDYFVDEGSDYYLEHKIFDATFVIQQTLKIADMVTTTQEYLAKILRKYNKNVVILPNFMDMERWKKPILKNTSDILRIGWAGGIGHTEDWKMIVKPLKRILKEFKNTMLIIVGDPRNGIPFEGYRMENMPGVPFKFWPTKLQSLRLDIGLAPLKDNEFNRCKSRIKFYEYAIAGVPGVFSPTAYMERAFDGHFGMIADNEDQWYRCLKNLVICPELRHDLSNAAYQHVIERCSLKKNIGLWVKAYQNLTLPQSNS